AAGSPEDCVVYCDEIPNLISIRDCEEISERSVPALGFRVTPDESYFRSVSFPDLVQRDPELARIYGWEVVMPRVYGIDDEKLKHNFALVFDANGHITTQVPDSMRRFVDKPLPPAVNQAFDKIDRDVIRRAT